MPQRKDRWLQVHPDPLEALTSNGTSLEDQTLPGDRTAWPLNPAKSSNDGREWLASTLNLKKTTASASRDTIQAHGQMARPMQMAGRLEAWENREAWPDLRVPSLSWMQPLTDMQLGRRLEGKPLSC